jgi:hypothetical protein
MRIILAIAAILGVLTGAILSASAVEQANPIQGSTTQIQAPQTVIQGSSPILQGSSPDLQGN